MRGGVLRRLAALVLFSWAAAAAGQDAPAATPSGNPRVAEAVNRGYWVVANGEQLLRISRLFTADMREARRLARELVALNPDAFPLGDPTNLAAGTRLRLPARLLKAGEAKSTPSPLGAAGAPAIAMAPALTAAAPPAPASPVVAPAAPPKPTVVSAPLPSRTSSSERAVPFEVTVNSAKGGTWLFLERAGALYAPGDAFEEWRVQLDPDAKAITFKGQRYWPLSAVPGFKAKVDFATQSVELLFSPQAFTALRLTTEIAKRPKVSPVLPSVFLNYDVNYSRNDPRGASTIHDLGVLTEAGVSGPWGVLTSTQVGRNLAGDTALGRSRNFLRLETTLTKDFPDRNRTLRLGDTNTRAGLWGRNVYFGGIQLGTNYALTPGFITQPLPTLRGSSIAPSTVELYVNDVLRQVSSVPTGPFAIDNFPVMTGNGEARMVVRDLLGRETVIVQSFFATSRLLAKGLDDWSFEAGTVRRDLGNASNDYGAGFASGMWRYGYSDELSLEGRAEKTRKLRTLGLGVSKALPGQFVGTAAFVASDHDGLGSGNLWLLGLEREGLRTSLNFQAQGATARFRLLGQDEAIAPIKLQVAGNWTYASPKAGTFGLGFASLSRYDDSRISTVSGNYSIGLWGHSTLTLTVSRGVAGDSGTAVGMSYVMPFDNNRAYSATTNSRDGRHDAYVAAQQNPSPATDLGWRVLAGQVQDQARAEGGIHYQGRYGTLNGELSASPDLKATRLGTTGGLVLADGNLFATRRLDQSFAVAEVAGYGDIGIGLGSNILTRTDAKGVALIPQLWPYQKNSIRIDPNELPLSAEVDSIEQVIVPAWRSGVKVTFPVRSGRGALLRIVLDDGEAAPAGAIAQIEGDKEEFYVARRGEAFVTGLQTTNRVMLKWKGRRCTFDVALPPEAPDEFARVGPLHCKGVTR